MRGAIEYLEAARSGRGVDLGAIGALKLAPLQVGALAASLWHYGASTSHRSFIEILAGLGFETDDSTIVRGADDNRWWPLVHQVRSRSAPEPANLSVCLKNLEEDSAQGLLLSGVFLSLCDLGYFPEAGIPDLTASFIDSGRIFDYRDEFHKSGFKLVRRYPTGGLSEKCALLLPAMVECFGNKLGIKSPFSVGRALGFTGGTWDKLSSIEGFKFPNPGDETVEVLNRGNCAITVTIGDAAPADRVIYLRRNDTSTIECEALIISSIASKHAAIPVDGLVLDTRVGADAFIPDEITANRIGTLVQGALRPYRVSVLTSVVDNSEPNGSAIGNYLEVLESIEIIRNLHSGVFDLRGKRIQLCICCDFFAKMVGMVRPEQDASEIVAAIEQAIDAGELWDAQKRFLANHSVSPEVIDQLERDPWSPMSNVESKDILSPCTGYLRGIHQRSLGLRVNNAFQEERRDPRLSGAVLRKRRYDPVRQGEVLCRVYAPEATRFNERELLEALFEFG